MAQPSLFDEPAPTTFGAIAVRQVTARTILTPANGRLAGYDFSLNPYVGCGFGCSYCYAAFFVPDERRALEWGRWVDVKANARELLRRSKGLAGARVYVGSVTDPYQPLERETGLTRSLLEFMVELRPQPRLVIQTRSDLPLRDLDLLRRFDHLRVNVSVTTDDDEVRKRFEPACLSIYRRLEGLRKLKAAGLRTSACLSPLLPIHSPETFAQTLAELPADRYGVSPFHETRGRFAAGTRPLALTLAQEHGWDGAAYADAVGRMGRVLRFRGAFDPE